MNVATLIAVGDRTNTGESAADVVAATVAASDTAAEGVDAPGAAHFLLLLACCSHLLLSSLLLSLVD